MYQSDEGVTDQISGSVVLEDTDGKAIVKAGIKVEAGISSYMNQIPESVYTENENPSLSIPVTLEVTQGEKTVYTVSQRDFTTDGAADDSFSYDITNSINPDEAYEVSWTAAVFDKTVELAHVNVAKKDESKDPSDGGKDDGKDDVKDDGKDDGKNNGKDDGSGGDKKTPVTKPSDPGNGTGNKSTKTTNAGNAKTGDETPVVLYMLLAAAGLGGISLVIIKKKHIRKS